MKIENKRLFWVVPFVVILATLFLPAPRVPAAPPQGVLKEAIHWGVSADFLDPAISGSHISTFTLYLFHDALLKPMPDEIYAPCLAESWKISPDAKVYEFSLRKGVKFHNGDEMTAEDVVFSFWRYKGDQAKSIHGKTEKVEAVNPYLVRFQFKEPFPDFLDYHLPGSTTIGWVVPKKYVEKVGDAGFKRNPIGCGPYKFVEFVPGVKIVAEAFEQYWRKVPPIKRIEFHIVSETATRLAMVRRGEMDVGTLMQGVFYDDVKKDPKLRLLSPISPIKFLIYMTAQWDPKSPWSDVRVRRAASLALDRQSLADIHGPGSKPAGSIGLEGDPSMIQFPPDPYDPEGARKLLAEAGYAKGFHGGKFYPFESGYWPMGEQIATYWKTIGIKVDTVLLDRPAWMAQRDGGKMKGGLFKDTAYAPTIAGRLSYLFGSTSYGNYPDIQSLWDQYQKETAPQTRKALIAKIQNLIREKVMFIPIRGGVSPAAFGPRVKGNPYKIQPLIWWTCPFEDIEITN
jgi:peptide/nickel transport system substrate-binding protein